MAGARSPASLKLERGISRFRALFLANREAPCIPTAPPFQSNMADPKSIEQRVQAIIVQQLNVDEAKVIPTASFLDDLGADSLDTVELIMAFEEEFKDELKGEIPEADHEKLRTGGMVIDYIKGKAGHS